MNENTNTSISLLLSDKLFDRWLKKYAKNYLRLQKEQLLKKEKK